MKLFFRKKAEPVEETPEEVPVKVEVVEIPDLTVGYLFRFMLNWSIATFLWALIVVIPIYFLLAIFGIVR